MKRKLIITLEIVLYFVLFSLSFLAAYYIASWMFKWTVDFLEILKSFTVSIIGIFILILFMTVIHILYHKSRRHKLHKKIYFDINDALDRIAKGDFNVDIDISDEHNRFTELAGKVNTMARGLNGMETMRQDFISNVSHEIQSPLTSIRGFITLLKNDNIKKEDRLHYINIIETESLRLSKLSDNLLKLSTLESEYAPFQPESYSLNKQIREIILMLEPQWSAKNIELSLEDEQEVHITADKELLSQVWINILHNSIKFTPEKGKITVSVFKTGSDVKVTVKDNGIGMTSEVLTHIFERFYMADKSRSRKAGGNGLGLSIVKKIVEMHHGKIEVKSKPSEGTAFNIKLPCGSVR